MKTLGIFEIKTHLSQVCDDVAASGESVLVTRRGKPFVRIDPLDSPCDGISEVWEARERYLSGQTLEEELPDVKRSGERISTPFTEDDL